MGWFLTASAAAEASRKACQLLDGSVRMLGRLSPELAIRRQRMQIDAGAEAHLTVDCSVLCIAQARCGRASGGLLDGRSHKLVRHDWKGWDDETEKG